MDTLDFSPKLRRAGPVLTDRKTLALRDEIGSFAATFGSMAADLKDNQDKLLAFARGLEHKVSQRIAELAEEKAHLALNVAERTAQLNEANTALRAQAAELSKRNQEITLFSRMTDFLQTSATEREAYSIISESVAELFPQDSGAVFVLGPSRDVLEAVAVWGPLAPANTTFPATGCWAHRRGQLHVGAGRERWCPHVTDDGNMYMCLPLLAQGEMLGILYLHDSAIGSERADEARMAAKCRLAKILADAIGLGIAHLKLREAMCTLSTRDPLTGLFNRRYMEEALEQELHRAKRSETQLAVIMIDTDHFKDINDQFGHDGGDAVLRSLGGFFKKHVRGSDIACRYGGDEFILILSGSGHEGALHRAETLRQEAGHLTVRHANQELGVITLSLGVAVYPDHALEAGAMVKAADTALYQAKCAGRNQVAVSGSKPAKAES